MKTIIGDLLAIPSGIIAHQVNCVGATGGLAGALRRKYPKAFGPYLAACEKGETSMPGAFIRDGAVEYGLAHGRGDGLVIAHVFGQINPGPCTDLRMVDRGLDLLRRSGIYEEGGPIYFPHLMGCGLGGGRWEQYRPLLEKHFPSATIVKLPE